MIKNAQLGEKEYKYAVKVKFWYVDTENVLDENRCE